MAKISSPWVGSATGKLGEGVYYRGYGRQLARSRNRAPRNPKTLSQALQRMSLRNAGKLASSLSSLIDHSWEGQVPWKSRASFLSSAVKRIKELVSDYPASRFLPVAYANSSLGVVPDGLQLSNGSLASFLSLQTSVGEHDAFQVVHADSQVPDSVVALPAEALFQRLGLPFKSQLTFVTAWSGTVQNGNGQYFDFVRVNLAESTQPNDGVVILDETFASLEGVSVFRFHEDFISRYNSSSMAEISELRIALSAKGVAIFRVDMADVAGMGLIGSALVGDKWLRSSSTLGAFETDQVYNDIQPVLDEYFGATGKFSDQPLNEADNDFIDRGQWSV